ncbi:ROK family transcriptional regulator [Agromyces sp. NPDC055520]
MNDRMALAMLLEHGVLTRNRIRDLSGLSKPTAAQIVSRLEAAGLIEATGSVAGARGPSAVGYTVRLDRSIGVAVDVTTTALRSTLVDVAGTEHPVAVTHRPQGERIGASGELRLAIDAAARAAGADPAVVRRTVIALPASVDAERDELAFAEGMPGWPRRGTRAHLEAELGVRVTLDNDVKLAAIAERTSGAGQGREGFALLWLGNGLGVAADLGSTLVRGTSGGAGEIGYLEVPKAAAAIDPAAVDLQGLVGGPTVARMLRERGLRGRTLDERLARLAEAPTELRDAVLVDLAPRIALAAAPLLAVLDPGLIVLGGPTGAAGGDRLAELVRARLRRTTRWTPDVAATGVPAQPALRGARDRLLVEVRTALLDEVAGPSGPSTGSPPPPQAQPDHPGTT